MLVKEYQAELVAIIQQNIDDEWILAYNFAVDTRSNYLAFIEGKLEFKDNSCLFFKEFVDLQETLE